VAPTQPCDANTGLVSRAQDLSGNQLPQSPKTKLAINGTYSWVTDRGTLSPSVSYIWRDKQYSNIFTRALGAAPSWDQWDARVTWKDKDNKYSIIAFVKNIGDTLGYDGGAGAGRTTGSYAQSTITAAGMTKGLPVSATCNTAINNCNFQAVQGFTTSYALTPPRTYGVEFQYRF
jgi:iron complex outermembrane receptor protein